MSLFDLTDVCAPFCEATRLVYEKWEKVEKNSCLRGFFLLFTQNFERIQQDEHFPAENMLKVLKVLVWIQNLQEIWAKD